MALNPDILNEVETTDEILDDLLTQSKEDFDKLTPLLARFSKLSASSNPKIIGKYSSLVQDACKGWENRNDKALIDEAFEKWKGDLEQIDDVCVIGVRI